MWTVLLTTAIIELRNVNSDFSKLRALIDQGSQNSFITEYAANLLGLKRERASVIISGIGSATRKCRGQVSITTTEKCSNGEIGTIALIIDTITKPLPSATTRNDGDIGLTLAVLADPDYRIKGRIDVLLGADIYGDILLDGIIHGTPTTQKKKIGWILSDLIATPQADNISISFVNTNDLDKRLEKFWIQEEVVSRGMLSKEEKECEAHYQATTKRLEDGRFEVQLPLKADPRIHRAPSSKAANLKYEAHEKRMLKNPKLLREYNECLQDYLDCGHMEKIPKDEMSLPSYYHIKESLRTTKVRVVFNVSAKTASGKSLNDLLMTRPTIQSLIITLLLRWRLYPVVLIADVAKMYRQIRVRSKSADLQRIVWRPNEADVIRHYRLKTITFVTANAPFQATRTLYHLAMNEQD
ncbi:uncharacterized protein LOC119653971 [Hermetia illucens]|uniref:uncharacterized protein LOC119653971 n=1 Tax=Hermetia illucens TaxID=343691 RepID=UPI0018CC4352|nr:uncharacterized protein LOC119653971 [Hermetia illucens]